MQIVGMNTTAGSFSLLGSIVPDDAGVVKRLRAAGAIILGSSIFSTNDTIKCSSSGLKGRLIYLSGLISAGTYLMAGQDVGSSVQMHTSRMQTHVVPQPVLVSQHLLD